MDANILNTLIADKQFKAHVQFLKLARDCLAANPLVSYWALYYVLEQGIKTPVQDDAFRRQLGVIMTVLEKEKSSRKGDPLFDSEAESRKFIENYANQLLVRAENEVELGVSPSVSIKIYLSAAHVSTLLTLFGDNSEENTKRIKYCKWKAVTIAKEAKSGGGGGGGNSSGGGGGGDLDEHNAPPPPSYGDSNDDYAANSSASDYSSGTRGGFDRQPSEAEKKPEEDDDANIDFANLSLSDSNLKKAELLCESALYAIQSKDILSAVTSLKQTMAVLLKGARK